MSTGPSDLGALLDAIPDATVIVDGDGRIQHANAQAERLFGHARMDLLGRPIELLLPECGDILVLRRHVEAGRTRPTGSAAIELRALRKDGTDFPAEVSVGPMPNGHAELIVATIRDGTTRWKAEGKFRRLLEAAPDAMVITGRDGRIALVNAQAEALFGYSRFELLAKPIEMLIPDRFRAAHPSHRRRYFAEPRIRPMGAGGLALFVKRKDGTEFPAEISLSPLETEEGVVAITTIRDITDRKNAELERVKLGQAQEALRMRDEFLSIASHELKTPLTALLMQVDSLIRMTRSDAKSSLSERADHRLGAIRSSVQRLNKLIIELLDLSRITSGRLDIQLEEVDLAAIVHRVVGEFGDEIARAGCELRLHVDEPVTGRWDALRVEQIVANLLSNAIKYGQGKPIEIAVAAEDAGTARLTVRDHGIGIAPEHQARIFERFERLVSSRNYGGFGLGLWIVRKIIEAHGGTIRVWSQPGAGSTFTVELPRQLDAPLGAEGSAPAGSVASVLLVDDDAMIRESFVDALDDAGIKAIAAADGNEALRLLRGGLRPGVILLDLMMPVMDGASFRAEQQKDPALAGIPVVVISAASTIEKQASDLGIAEYLNKPIELESVLRIISRYASPRAAQKGA